MRISDKKRRDENHVLEVLYKKENEREVPRHSSLFYNSAYKLMRNMDVGYQEQKVSDAMMMEEEEDEVETELESLGLLRMTPVPLTYSNVPPMTRD